jgi:hypothetical protein
MDIWLDRLLALLIYLIPAAAAAVAVWLYPRVALRWVLLPGGVLSLSLVGVLLLMLYPFLEQVYGLPKDWVGAALLGLCGLCPVVMAFVMGARLSTSSLSAFQNWFLAFLAGMSGYLLAVILPLIPFVVVYKPQMDFVYPLSVFLAFLLLVVLLVVFYRPEWDPARLGSLLAVILLFVLLVADYQPELDPVLQLGFLLAFLLSFVALGYVLTKERKGATDKVICPNCGGDQCTISRVHYDEKTGKRAMSSGQTMGLVLSMLALCFLLALGGYFLSVDTGNHGDAWANVVQAIVATYLLALAVSSVGVVTWIALLPKRATVRVETDTTCRLCGHKWVMRPDGVSQLSPTPEQPPG